MNSEIPEVYLVFDTNILRKNEKDVETFDEFYIYRYDEITKLINSYNLNDKVFLLIPEIVLTELIIHKKSKLNLWINTIEKYSKNFAELHGFLDKLSAIQVDKHIEQIKDRKLSSLEIIPIPPNKESLFDNILERCIEKIPPFQKGESDKGFKDTILFLSLLNYAKDFSNVRFVLFSKDKGFSEDEQRKILEDEFSKTGNSLEIRDDVDVEGYLKNLFGMDFEFQDYISQDLLPEIEEEISNYTKISYKGKECPILSINLDASSTYQEEISQEQTKIVFAFILEYVDEGKTFEITDLTKEFILNKKEKQIISRSGYNYELLSD